MTDLIPGRAQRYDNAVPLDAIHPHPENVNEGDVGAISHSMTENGWYGAVIVQELTGRIIAGKHRWLTAQHLGADTVPVIWLDVDDDRARRIMLADNRTSRLGRDDEASLAELLQDLANTDSGLAGTGYDTDDLDDLIKMLEVPSLDDLAKEVGEPTDSDFWPVVKIKVPPEVHEAWVRIVEFRHSGDDARAFGALVEHYDAHTEDDA